MKKNSLPVLGVLCWLAFWGVSHPLAAQNSPTYRPIRLEREVPGEVVADLGKSAQEINGQLGTTALSTEDKQEFAYRVAVELRLYHLASQLFYDGPIYDYVNKVAAHLLRYDEETLGKIRIYISKSTAVNALTFPDGTILVNLGLLMRVKNEAQLAFVLAHEIAHFQKRHGLHKEEKGKEVNLKKKEVRAVFEGTGNPDRLLSLFKFSRENEAEADLEGLALYLQSDYDPNEAIAALELLKTADQAMEEGDVNLFMHFHKGEFTVDTAKIRSFTRSELEAQHQDEAEDEESEATGINKKKKYSIDASDLSTHPDIDTRVAAIKAQLEKTPKKSGKSLPFVQTEKSFAALITAALNESLISWEQNARYQWALYNALRRFETDPYNQFLIEQAAQNLFWICVIARTDEELAVPNWDKTENPGLAHLLYFLGKHSDGDIAKATKGFLDAYQAEFPKSEVLLILQGRLASVMKDPATAMSKYEEYLTRFPDGDHAAFAQYQKDHAL
jgi:predicted Zn-dependent protease